MRTVLLLAALGAIVAPAMAVESKPAPAGKLTDAGFDWNGFYAGLHGGYVGGTARAVGANSITITDTPLNGYVLGATLGGNVQFQQFVLGAEGDLAWSGVRGSAICSGAPAANCETDLTWLGALKARAGVAVNRVMVYGHGGIAFAGGRARATPAQAGTSGVFEEIYTGLTVGFGAEVAINQAMSVKAEYGLYDFAGRDAPVGTLDAAEPVSVRPMMHSVKVGANWQF